MGLASDGVNLVVFGHAAAEPTGLPEWLTYSQIEHPDGLQLRRVPSWTVFGDKVAAIGAFGPDMERYIFEGTTRVDDVEAPPNIDAAVQPFSIATFASKLFCGAATRLHFSAIRDGDDWSTTASGAGSIDMAFRIGLKANVRATAEYEDYLAVFFERAIMTWIFDVDPDASAPVQTIKGPGTFSSRTVLPYRSGDVLFFDPTGIRSLRARDSSKSALTADIGSAIDTLTRAAYADAPADRIELASAVIEPVTGRVWFAIEDTIFVLSQYEVTKVTAWSVYKPGFVVDAMVVHNDRVYLRSGEDFYVYGSTAGPYVYSEDVPAEVWLPYLDAGTPTQHKRLHGVDAAVRGTWEVRIGYDPENLDATDLLARISGTTYFAPRLVVEQGGGSHLGLRFRSLGPVSETEPAILSSAVIHHDLDDQVDS